MGRAHHVLTLLHGEQSQYRLQYVFDIQLTLQKEHARIRGGSLAQLNSAHISTPLWANAALVAPACRLGFCHSTVDVSTAYRENVEERSSPKVRIRRFHRHQDSLDGGIGGAQNATEMSKERH